MKIEKTKLLIITFTFIFINVINISSSVTAEYISNYDGDTVKFNIPKYPDIIGEKINIRLNGIDTPEIRGKSKEEKYLAEKAKVFVHNLLKEAKIIELKNLKRGKYFRIIADVYFDGKNLADILLKNELAVCYDGKRKNHVWN